ncbi:hypothetical protein GCM10027176_16850 [Actinoallomurus bryophytorum]|uniref:Uncharacterized protein n=1 Tax=Actinoallomurus bryophytorum TaxID=1490222 RepID=A0A543CLN9_9ACTN|nr:hypothetical protein [Actinoallomurus bryophytorum]TQL98023.1 hypothetical protein FB559_3637 [Actinoallomurus bryophytorum]
MRPLALTGNSQKVIADWQATNPPEVAKVRLAEVVATLEDGTWDAPRWHPLDDPPNPDFVALRPGQSLQIYFHIVVDDAPDYREVADIVSIDVDERYNLPFAEAPER